MKANNIILCVNDYRGLPGSYKGQYHIGQIANPLPRVTTISSQSPNPLSCVALSRS